MELLDIIVFTLKIFGLSAIIIVSISYLVFKIKDRHRIKPYMKQSSTTVQQPPEIKYEEQVLSPSRFQILNETPNSHPKNIQVEEQDFGYERPQALNRYKTVPVNNFKKEIKTNTNDIFNYYSKNTFEPMYKVKN